MTLSVLCLRRVWATAQVLALSTLALASKNCPVPSEIQNVSTQSLTPATYTQQVLPNTDYAVINDNGIVAGHGSYFPSYNNFLWYPPYGTEQIVAVPLSEPYVKVQGLNNMLDLCGYDDWSGVGFTYINGTYKTWANPRDQWYSTKLIAINDKLQAVGYYGQITPFLLDISSGTFTDISVSLLEPHPTGITNDGLISGLGSCDDNFVVSWLYKVNSTTVQYWRGISFNNVNNNGYVVGPADVGAVISLTALTSSKLSVEPRLTLQGGSMLQSMNIKGVGVGYNQSGSGPVWYLTSVENFPPPSPPVIVFQESMLKNQVSYSLANCPGAYFTANVNGSHDPNPGGYITTLVWQLRDSGGKAILSHTTYNTSWFDFWTWTVFWNPTIFPNQKFKPFQYLVYSLKVTGTNNFGVSASSLAPAYLFPSLTSSPNQYYFPQAYAGGPYFLTCSSNLTMNGSLSHPFAIPSITVPQSQVNFLYSWSISTLTGVTLAQLTSKNPLYKISMGGLHISPGTGPYKVLLTYYSTLWKYGSTVSYNSPVYQTTLYAPATCP